jgi:hypothetical protein
MIREWLGKPDLLIVSGAIASMAWLLLNIRLRMFNPNNEEWRRDRLTFSILMVALLSSFILMLSMMKISDDNPLFVRGVSVDWWIFIQMPIGLFCLWLVLRRLRAGRIGLDSSLFLGLYGLYAGLIGSLYVILSILAILKAMFAR